MKSLFDIIPERFFSPLSATNKKHYCAALLIFYEKFIVSPSGVERDALVDALEKYCVAADFSPEEENPDMQAADFRAMARLLLSKITDSGWVSEETLQDFTRIVNIAPYAKPFFDVLYNAVQGGGVEYESHIVAVYSLICGEASAYNGHFTVLRAHEHTILLLDSLKVLSQSIKRHFEILHQSSAEIPDILRAHYDAYMPEVIDAAYTRLKTNDNLSKYRPQIIERINELLADELWVDSTSAKLKTIRIIPSGQTPQTYLCRMLEDMRESLRAIDPVMDDIDRRNRQYSKISTEKIKNRLYSDSTISGKLIKIAGALHAGDIDSSEPAYNIFRFRSLSSESLYSRWRGEAGVREAEREVPYCREDIDAIEAEMRRKIELQLNSRKISDFLDSAIGSREEASASEIVADMPAFIRILYAAVYSEASGKKFPFGILWHGEETSADGGRFVFQNHSFRRKRNAEKEND